MKILLLSDTHITAARTICNDNLDAVKSYLKGEDVDFAIHLGDVSADARPIPRSRR